MRNYLLLLFTFLFLCPQHSHAASANLIAQEIATFSPKIEKVKATTTSNFIGLVKEVVIRQIHKIQAISLKIFTIIASILSVFVLAACVYFAMKITKNADLGKAKPYITAALAILYSMIYVMILGVLTENFFKKKE